MEGEGQEMKKERKVVVALDTSEESFYALQWALSTLSLRPQLDILILLHAKSAPTTIPTFAGDTGYVLSTEMIESMELAQNCAIDAFMGRALELCKQKQVAAEKQVVFGDPRNVICEAVDKSNADFLVIGSHGYGAIKRVMLGSVSDYCAHHVKCPILIVKKPKDNQKH